MKRLIVVCMALVLALAPAATAEAAKGGKSKGAAKTCVAKKSVKGKKGKKAAKKAAAKKKAKKAKKTTSAATAGAERECRADRRLDPEGFAADFGGSADAVAKCAAELLGQGAGDEVLPDDEPLEDELPETEPADEGAADPAPFDAEDDLPGNDDDIV